MRDDEGALRGGKESMRWLLIALSWLLIGTGCDSTAAGFPSPQRPPHDAVSPSSAPAPPPPPTLPRGGTSWFPQYRIVTYYGTAGSGVLGVLGEQTPQLAADRLEEAAAAFGTPDRQLQPAMELIVTVADGHPGAEGSYSHQLDPAMAWQYLAVARAHRQLLILDLQPGHVDFLTAAQRWAPLLAQPDVGLALDPEWRMPDGAVPGQRIGHVDADEVNVVTDWLARLTREQGLPQKVLVLHQFTDTMLGDVDAIAAHPELAFVQHLDGFGAAANKIAKYRDLQRPDRFHLGFKLFYTEDTDLLSPSATLQLTPPPEYVSYQ